MSLLWTQADWLAGAVAWIRERVEVTGEIEQPHVRWWSTVLRVPTAEGDLWFKASSPLHAFEPRLIVELARIRPELVPEVVELEPERGWMLMRDAGTRLREALGSADDLYRWEELLPLYAELQLAVADEAEELLRMGVPDERLAGLPARFARLLEDRETLLVDREDGLSESEYEWLRASTAEVERLCRELASYGIPETIQHDDLHDGNVFVRDGHYVVFDWGDSCVSHPFHTLVVTLRAAAWKFALAPGHAKLERMRDAYLEPFAPYGRRTDLLEAFDTAYRVGTIGRALAWFRAVAARVPHLSPDEADSVPYGLKLFLENEPIGSWR